RVAAILRELGLWELRRRFPAQLSGGQRQRVAIARALVLEPDVLLMDEPFSSLDALTREVMQDLLAEIGGQLTWVLVTHDIAEAVFLGQKILVMDGGRVVKEIANPDALKQGYRSQPRFLELCSLLREHLRLPTGVSRVA
ncbi:MAG TPA: ATP-binding cassette domain-containing protein, partial [Firmicutes bacterium]|nr:ATP-binding cassette domain-containing protein [Bacillota bacterium]